MCDVAGHVSSVCSICLELRDALPASCAQRYVPQVSPEALGSQISLWVSRDLWILPGYSCLPGALRFPYVSTALRSCSHHTGRLLGRPARMWSRGKRVSFLKISNTEVAKEMLEHKVGADRTSPPGREHNPQPPPTTTTHPQELLLP